MSLLDIFRTRAEPLAADADDALLSAWLSGDKLQRDKAMEIPALSGCIDKIAKTVANIPIRLYKREGKTVKEIKDDPRVFLLNAETGDTLDAVQMKQALIRDYYLGKGGFCYVEWQSNEVKSLRYVYEGDVSTVKNSDPIFKDYVILVGSKTYYPHEFVRILRNSKDGVTGSSIVDENEKLLSVAYNTLKYEENLVKTGGNKKGFLKTEKKLDQESLDRLKAAWNRLYRNNSENVVVLNNGLEFQEASNTSVEMQLNENKQTNAEEICKIFDIPPSILNGNMTEQDEKAFIKYCINNLIGELMTALDRALLLESEKKNYFFAADTYELVKGDIDKRYSAYEVGLRNGFLQIDEVRTKENLDPLKLDFIKLGLQDVLYNPKDETVYTPNTNKLTKMGEMPEGGEETWQGSNSEGKPSSLTDMSTSQDGIPDRSPTETEDTSLNKSKKAPLKKPLKERKK